jgi:hypothetical protein
MHDQIKLINVDRLILSRSLALLANSAGVHTAVGRRHADGFLHAATRKVSRRRVNLSIYHSAQAF